MTAAALGPSAGPRRSVAPDVVLEAYEILARCKRPGQSFSQTIKQRLGAKMTGADLFAVVRGARVSEETLDAIDAQVTARRSSRARRVRL